MFYTDCFKDLFKGLAAFDFQMKVFTTQLPFLARRGHDILEKVLPAKEEHIMFVRLSPLQKSLYQRYIDSEGQKFGAVNPIKAFSVCCKVSI